MKRRIVKIAIQSKNATIRTGNNLQLEGNFDHFYGNFSNKISLRLVVICVKICFSVVKNFDPRFRRCKIFEKPANRRGRLQEILSVQILVENLVRTCPRW